MTEPHANPEDLDLYALGALDGEEKQTLEAHLRACPHCQQQLAAARQRTALMGLAAAPAAPRPQVKAALMDKVRAEKRVGVTQTAPPKIRKKRWGLRFSFGFGLATVLLAFATYELAKQDLNRGKQLQQLQAQVSEDATALQAMGQVTGAPDSAQITLLQQPNGPPGQAHMLYNARMGLGVYSGQIAPAPSGKSYQLWLVPSSGAPVSAGLVNANQQNGAVVVRLAPGLAPKAFAVTLEPLGGRPQPTGPMVLVGAAS
ncbi:MAG: anti-sigma factor [Terracidiphilus sp.]|jgi:anti-sigma-K factor RskA